MNKKITLCAFMLLLVTMAVTHAKVLKDNKQDSELLNDARHEIDNYDFLYDGTEYDFDYDTRAMDNIMDEAFSHLGARYRSGAKGPSAFDCSGFTSYVYGQLDISIGSSSRDQFAKNTPIKKDELQRGDLVFFTSPRSGRGVGHVGIVVDVDQAAGTFSFIHASSKGGVKVSNSTDGYYTRRYIGARRVM